MSCDRCPAKGNCLGWEAFCAWAAEEPPDPVRLAHIRARSAMGEKPDPAAYPSLPRLAANFAHAFFDWAVSGFSMASEAEVARRLSICNECPEFQGSRCRICGCGLRAKAAMKTGHCPLPEPRW